MDGGHLTYEKDRDPKKLSERLFHLSTIGDEGYGYMFIALSPRKL